MLRFECYWRGIYLLFYYFNPDPRLIDSDFCKLELLKCLKFAGFLAHPVDLIFKFDYLYQTVQRWIHRLMKTITQQTQQTFNGNLILPSKEIRNPRDRNVDSGKHFLLLSSHYRIISKKQICAELIRFLNLVHTLKSDVQIFPTMIKYSVHKHFYVKWPKTTQ